ncbi:type II toxin-antitoxin system PemK/MazF family toxin [Labedella endophytica]|uniref:type II toxin-antitoxin system PemK/MazF family toxin n=1 Tax=Labedella endophytica TaxID=1523160 RepID=UPI001FB64AFC|nr:type II toxin-antitoxin system PemK/MazF family toxin [Labedella endophytica]
MDPRSLGRVRLEWAPSADGLPDPGEIVWTWVPYEENDGRGKDRPVLIVSAGRSGLLGVQLTSKDHDGDADHVSIGTGAWDSAHRESWARLDRVFRVDASSVRREAAFLPEKTYRRVAKTLASRYGWTVV